jgi:hypothetical protein
MTASLKQAFNFNNHQRRSPPVTEADFKGKNGLDLVIVHRWQTISFEA